MLKRVVVVAMSLAGPTAPHAAETAVRSATPVSQTRGAAAPASDSIDPARQAWIRQTMDRLLDPDEDATGSVPHKAP